MKDITKLRIKTAAALLAFGFMFFISVGFLSSMLIKGCLEINDRGLKNIVEEVWEGRQSQEE